MPASTVFSYWRREHRRSSAPPVASSVQSGPKVKSAGNTAQLPVIHHTPVLATTVEESASLTDALSPLTSNEGSSSDLDPDKGHATVFAIPVRAPSSSATNLPVPSLVSDKHAHPPSSPEERDSESADLTAQSNLSQLSFTPSRPDYGDSDSSKPSSPFRLTFGKGLLNAHGQPSSDSHTRRSSTPVLMMSSVDKSNTMQKEYRLEGASSRRQTDRDLTADHTTHKSGKTRLHLLNPMSLLARRRSSQIAGLRAEDMNIRGRNVVPAIPDDYDPRIRGNIVHDFSAPRPRRNLSVTPVLLQDVVTHQSLNDSSQIGSGKEAPAQVSEHRKKHSEYSPVFKEHFEDDQNVLQIDNKAYLQSSLLTDTSLHGNEQSVPVFARKLPSRIPDHKEQTNQQSESQPEPPDPQVESQADTSGEQLPAAEPESDTVEITPHQPPASLKHFKSNASRFSFDMNGVESSAQEKLLEEKHKEKEAARRAQAGLEDREYSDLEDDYDNDLLDDLDDLEEKIPGVNADAEIDEFSSFSAPGAALTSSWYAPGLSPVVASPIITPETSMAFDSNPQVDCSLIPLIPVNPNLLIENSRVSPLSDEYDSEDHFEDPDGRFSPTEDHFEAAPTGYPMPAIPHPSVSQPVQEDDDLYFDDGEFGDLSAEVEGETFDESLFDDETSHLYARKTTAEPSASAPSEVQEVTPGLDEPSTGPSALDLGVVLNGGLKPAPSMVSGFRDPGRSMCGGRDIGGPASHLPPAKPHGGVLSAHNLEALHNALEKAAYDTTDMDRFDRSASVSERSIDQDSAAQTTQTMDSYSGLVSDDSHLSQALDVLSFEEVLDDFNYDDDDAAFYDDPIIAAANAEALENDDEGFYGQEFGFYAQAYGGPGSELTNGGYFGPHGIEGVSRSHSSRGKFREPSLTPITERSEWSTRNSVISVTAHGNAHSSLPSPGLAQFVDMGNFDDEMSLSALLRLRRGAWGGSNGSLRSNNGSPPPHQHPSSNRGSLTGFSDMSPSVQTVPPDYFFGGPSVAESPIQEVGACEPGAATDESAEAARRRRANMI